MLTEKVRVHGVYVVNLENGWYSGHLQEDGRILIRAIGYKKDRYDQWPKQTKAYFEVPAGWQEQDVPFLPDWYREKYRITKEEFYK